MAAQPMAAQGQVPFAYVGRLGSEEEREDAIALFVQDMFENYQHKKRLVLWIQEILCWKRPLLFFSLVASTNLILAYLMLSNSYFLSKICGILLFAILFDMITRFLHFAEISVPDIIEPNSDTPIYDGSKRRLRSFPELCEVYVRIREAWRDFKDQLIHVRNFHAVSVWAVVLVGLGVFLAATSAETLLFFLVNGLLVTPVLENMQPIRSKSIQAYKQAKLVIDQAGKYVDPYLDKINLLPIIVIDPPRSSAEFREELEHEREDFVTWAQQRDEMDEANENSGGSPLRYRNQ